MNGVRWIFPKKLYLNFCLISGILILVACKPDRTPSLSKDYPIKAHPFHKVEMTGQFWAPRLKTQRETLVPFAFEKTRPAVENLSRTAKFLQGIPDSLPFPHRYIASDLFKVMEGAANLLSAEEEPKLEMHMDSIIDIIAAAQQEDGYMYEAHVTGASKDHPHWGGGGMGDQPYSHVVHSHELYNMGHMYEAAIAYYMATGKRKWLDISEKNARHINRVFFEGDPKYNGGNPVMQAPGHQEIELALVKLYRTTGNSLYLHMAQKFLAIRSITYKPEGEQYMSPSYAQQHLPVSEQEEAVGHAVRAAYMFSAMADVDALTDTISYRPKLEKIWRNIVNTKMPITGGLGAQRGIEGFGPEYELPNSLSYNETCAAVANVLWNYRMFLLTGNPEFVDVAEISLYNNALAGVNMAGDRFFYVNPLESDGQYPFNHGEPGRSPWFNTACCPSNLARLIPQVSGMIYATAGNKLYCNLYASSHTTLELVNREISIEQETAYPYSGEVLFRLHFDKPAAFNIHLRIPTWSRAHFVPGILYRYARSEFTPYRVEVNGQVQEGEFENGYYVLDKIWIPGDEIRLILPMPLRFNTCLDSVVDNRNKMAVTMGPIVYCAEEIDNDPEFTSFTLSEKIPRAEIEINPIDEEPLRGVPKIQLTAFQSGHPSNSTKKLQFIPYFAWNNRGNGNMKVWINQVE